LTFARCDALAEESLIAFLVKQQVDTPGGYRVSLHVCRTTLMRDPIRHLPPPGANRGQAATIPQFRTLLGLLPGRPLDGPAAPTHQADAQPACSALSLTVTASSAPPRYTAAIAALVTSRRSQPRADSRARERRWSTASGGAWVTEDQLHLINVTPRRGRAGGHQVVQRPGQVMLGDQHNLLIDAKMVDRIPRNRPVERRASQGAGDEVPP